MSAEEGPDSASSTVEMDLRGPDGLETDVPADEAEVETAPVDFLGIVEKLYRFAQREKTEM